MTCNQIFHLLILLGTLRSTSVSAQVTAAPAEGEASCQPTSFTPSTCGTATLPLGTATLTPKLPDLKIPDEGYKYGNVIINNHCTEDLYVWSVGVWYLGGCRDTKTGFGTCEEMAPATIPKGGTYQEPYRMTCHQPNLTYWYCMDNDKTAGQGVSFKISQDPKAPGNITQFEYALGVNPARGDTFPRLDYDISLLDCGSIAGVTDASATPEQHQLKIDNCPGYGQGLSITFQPADGGTAPCRPFYCPGDKMCGSIYTFDRTRQGEMSLACDSEYHGNITLDLCANNAPNKQQNEEENNAWVSAHAGAPGAQAVDIAGSPQTESAGPGSAASEGPSALLSAPLAHDVNTNDPGGDSTTTIFTTSEVTITITAQMASAPPPANTQSGGARRRYDIGAEPEQSFCSKGSGTMNTCFAWPARTTLVTVPKRDVDAESSTVVYEDHIVIITTTMPSNLPLSPEYGLPSTLYAYKRNTGILARDEPGALAGDGINYGSKF